VVDGVGGDLIGRLGIGHGPGNDNDADAVNRHHALAVEAAPALNAAVDLVGPPLSPPLVFSTSPWHGHDPQKQQQTEAHPQERELWSGQGQGHPHLRQLPLEPPSGVAF